MPPLIQPGFRSPIPSRGRVQASTFVELVVAMILLLLFAALAFPILWGATKATSSHDLDAVAQRAKLSLITQLPRFADSVRPPLWENSDKVFQNDGSELRAAYLEGKEDGYLILRREGESRLRIEAGDAIISIDNLPGLAVDWWKKDGRIIGLAVSWRQGAERAEFRSAWGSFVL